MGRSVRLNGLFLERLSRILWATFLIVAFLAPSSSQAEALPILVESYRLGEEPLEISEPHELCSVSWADQIDFWWGGDLVGSCDYDRVLVHFSGQIQIPRETVLMVAHDDGAILELDGITVLNAWWDTPCVWDSITVDPGVYEFDLWVYENGGDACAQLLRSDPQGEGFQSVPPGWFSPSPPPPTTTTTEPPTTTSTTTEAPTTTSTEAPTTTEPPTSTSVAPSATEAPTTTEAQSPLTEPPSPSEPVTIPEAPTTTNTAPTPSSSVSPPTSISSTSSSSPASATSSTSVPSPSSSISPEAPDAPEEPQIPSENASPEEILSFAQNLSPSDLEALSDEDLAQAVDQIISSGALDDLSDEQIINIVSEIVVSDVFDSLDEEQVAEIIDEISNAEFTPEQAEQIAVALSSAPDYVKEAFEEQVDVFDGLFDSYVPSGSNVSVGVRRTIVAVVATTAMPLTPVSPTSRTRARKVTPR